MHRGGVRSRAGRDGNRERDRGGGRQRSRRGSRHPSGLSGKDIGLWYARRGRESKKARELQERAVVTMDRQREERISRLMQEMRTPTHQPSGTTAAGEGPSWRGADSLDGKTVQAKPEPESCSEEEFERDPYDLLQDDFPEDVVMSDEILPTTNAGELHHQASGATYRNSRSVHPPLEPKAELDTRLKEEFAEKKVSNVKYLALQDFRMKLPSYQMKEELLKLIAQNQVVVISGETGCGKTTQVAQFILDDAISSGVGSLCRIICTQPRRISAISVAERVAAERGEPCGQFNSVGYQIRLESKLPRTQGSILYCTTGVLLRWLTTDPLLQSASHIILDEIHERDLMSDFLLIIVRDMLPLRPDLKLILMSATLNAEMFSAYFSGCPMAHIPGFTYPVEEIYLETVLQITGHSVKQQDKFQRKEPKWKKYTKRKDAKKKRLQKSGMWPQQEGEGDESDDPEQDEWRGYLESIRLRFPPETITTLENMDFDKVDLDLVVKVITHISLNMEEGAILCFLPGWDDISKVHDSLTHNRLFSSDKFRIIPLHSMMPTSHQKEVFERPPPGVRKIVIATSIAETSITIDDVVFVVDCGKTKEKTYDAGNKISCLRPAWISKASSKQRRGRAGRVQPGFCFHLFTEFHAHALLDYQLPEMLRTPLEELCLQIKILKLGRIVPFLSKALQPPPEQAVQNALEVLLQLNALNEREELTPLGYHLATLPVDPRVGKMILFGAIFSCLDPVLTVASMLGFKDPFIIPLGKQKQAEQVKRTFAGDSCSDHIALLNAYRGWEASRQQGSYCWKNFLSMNTLKMIQSMKGQFVRLLCDIGFLSDADPKGTEANANSENTRLVKAVLCAGLYPNVVKIEHHATLKRPPVLRTPQDGRVSLHPKSVNVDRVVFEDNWLIYHLKIKSSKLFVHDSTMMSPYPLLFFGGEIRVFQEEGHDMISVDDVIKFRSPTRIASLVKELRQQLDRLLEQKIARPDIKLTVGCGADDKGAALIRAIIELITSQDTTSRRKRKSMEGNERS